MQPLTAVLMRWTTRSQACLRQDTTSMGEKLRQAVLSGSQDDLKRLFEQCSKAPAKKHHAVDEKRLAAFSAFDDLLSPSHRQESVDR
eukprot:g31273.t1